MSAVDSVSKEEIVKQFARGRTDTGSPEVQVALLTRRIETLTRHFGTHKKDKHSQRGMMRLIAHRKNLLQYLRGEDIERYRSLIGALGLRK